METGALADSQPAATAGAGARPSAAWGTVLILLTLSTFSQVDRRVIYMLVDPIRQDLSLSDTEMSLLMGPAFGLVYALAGLPLGWLADRWSRRWLIGAGAVLWGLGTAACGLSASFAQLFAARMGIGASEAAITPAAHSMIADRFAPERLAFPISVFGLAVAFGSGIGLAFGGIVFDAVSHGGALSLPLIGRVGAWQAVFLAAALPSVLLAFLPLLTPDAPRARRLAGPAPAAGSVWRLLAARPRLYAGLFLGISSTIVIATGMDAWVPTYIGRSFGWPHGQIGVVVGSADLVSGVAGYLVAGRLVDRLFRRGVRDAHLRWLALAHLVGAPIILTGLLVGNAWLFIALTGLYHFIVWPCLGYGGAAVQILAPPALRGRMASVFFLFVQLTGALVGPVLTALITEHVFHDPHQLGPSMAALVAIFAPISALLAWQGMKPMREAVGPATARD
jgi:MFS family permease